MAKKRRKPKDKKPSKPPARWIRIRDDKPRPMIREAARAGLVEAIEHCGNFWSVSDGYKKYIDYQIKSAAEALMAAVRSALREEITRRNASLSLKCDTRRTHANFRVQQPHGMLTLRGTKI